jgi:DMSO/TMAO reductase YedYZ molybdopterin-dependent catalytic subunit
MPFAKRGYPDFEPRIPPGWRVVLSDPWPINTTIGPDEDSPDLDTWRFGTCGEVTNSLSLTYEEFRSLPHVTIVADHHCIDGWSYLGHEWGGVHLREITKRTMPSDRTKHILIECERGVSQTFPIDQDLLFATERNGKPLTREGGFPLRVVAPGEYGYRSSKWVRRINFTSTREQDFYEKAVTLLGIPPIPPEENPWNCNDLERKKLLKTVFSGMLEEERKRRMDKWAIEHGKSK